MVGHECHYVWARADYAHSFFLTLLLPSRLEARLIFFLLDPLAVVAAIMQLFHVHHRSPFTPISFTVRNVCNATLSLLFTTFLFIWGLYVNRSRAWRIDGGTAIFGASALGLALVSTGLSFLRISREDYVWLPGLTWSLIVWQSFFGWWWWVGAGGMSCVGLAGEVSVDGRTKRAGKKERKAKERFKSGQAKGPKKRSGEDTQTSAELPAALSNASVNNGPRDQDAKSTSIPESVQGWRRWCAWPRLSYWITARSHVAEAVEMDTKRDSCRSASSTRVGHAVDDRQRRWDTGSSRGAAPDQWKHAVLVAKCS